MDAIFVAAFGDAAGVAPSGDDVVTGLEVGGNGNVISLADGTVGSMYCYVTSDVGRISRPQCEEVQQHHQFVGPRELAPDVCRHTPNRRVGTPGVGSARVLEYDGYQLIPIIAGEGYAEGVAVGSVSREARLNS